MLDSTLANSDTASPDSKNELIMTGDDFAVNENEVWAGD
jgi:hypothetical protein